MELKADFRLMLTGTPLQNHLNEIWNLFQFANPGLLGSYQQFTDRFILPIERDHDQERQRLLRRLLSPFLLRRTKDDVLNELPEKTEITLRVELSLVHWGCRISQVQEVPCSYLVQIPHEQDIVCRSESLS